MKECVFQLQMFFIPILNGIYITFLPKEQRYKAGSSFSRKALFCSAYPKLGEADPVGLGACPQEKIDKRYYVTVILLSYQRQPNQCLCPIDLLFFGLRLDLIVPRRSPVRLGRV